MESKSKKVKAFVFSICEQIKNANVVHIIFNILFFTTNLTKLLKIVYKKKKSAFFI